MLVLPRLTTQTLPAPSMAMPSGILRPPPVYPRELEMGEPEAPNRLILSAPVELSAAHTLPEASTARPQGSARPPPVSPVEVETGLPVELSSLRLFGVTFAVQIWPELSMAML